MNECACALSGNVLICMERGGRSVFIDVVRDVRRSDVMRVAVKGNVARSLSHFVFFTNVRVRSRT